ncbi:MAG: aldehyde dehydrogenase family protein, partial [Planctomycetia bacterium]
MIAFLPPISAITRFTIRPPAAAAACALIASPTARDPVKATTAWLPRGVTVVIAPWNFPLAILAGMTTAALVTGNTVVMKPAEQSS